MFILIKIEIKFVIYEKMDLKVGNINNGKIGKGIEKIKKNKKNFLKSEVLGLVF